MALSAQGMLFTGSSDKLIKKFNMKDAFAKYEVYKKQNPDAQHSGVVSLQMRYFSIFVFFFQKKYIYLFICFQLGSSSISFCV